MNTKKYLAKQVQIAIRLIVIGIIAGILDFIFQIQKDILIGLAAGFTPTGIGLLIISLIAQDKPAMMKTIALENEERNHFINSKAAQTTFWITFWFVFAATMTSNLITIQLAKFGAVLLIFIGGVYFSFVRYYHLKY